MLYKYNVVLSVSMKNKRVVKIETQYLSYNSSISCMKIPLIFIKCVGLGQQYVFRDEIQPNLMVMLSKERNIQVPPFMFKLSC